MRLFAMLIRGPAWIQHYDVFKTATLRKKRFLLSKDLLLKMNILVIVFAGYACTKLQTEKKISFQTKADMCGRVLNQSKRQKFTRRATKLSYSFTARNRSLAFHPEKVNLSLAESIKLHKKHPGFYSLSYFRPLK